MRHQEENLGEKSNQFHLLEHLFDLEDDSKASNKWTRVFSRDDSLDMKIPLFDIGQDLQVDKAMNDVLISSSLGDCQLD